ncbi:hypothetical protein KFK09_026997 [Dendrobium nobile]|uniref:Reverse transcriptase Ty1/copia-type domain-containing protein n=1 Tax=Dendrobium nobile TaxID=94219 RepID=A0A8T3A9T6_DENNO|nr:hypothetical protein KFK09_026997 [Dendrobium nobile]
MLLTVALHHAWQVNQLDVSNAFLHGDLNDEIYMKQPRGFEDNQHPNFVCKLHKSLYGLKQSPRQWFQKLMQSLHELGFQFSKADPSLLIFNQATISVYVLVYVDDILITGNDRNKIQSTIKHLQSQFNIKQLGAVSLFLGIQVIKTTTCYFLSQSHYATELLSHAGFMNCKLSKTPAHIKPSKTPDIQPYSDPQLFRNSPAPYNISP